MQKQSGKMTIRALLSVLIAVLVVGLGVTTYIYLSNMDILPSISELTNPDDVVDTGTIIEGVRVDDVNVSGMSLEEAMAAVAQAQRKAREGKVIELTLDDQQIKVSLDELNPSYDTEKVLSEAMQLGRSGTAQEQKEERLLIAEQGASFTTQMTIDDSALQSRMAQIAEPLYLEPVNAKASFNKELPDRFEYTLETSGRKVEAEALAVLVRQKIEKSDFTPAQIPYEPVEAEITVEKLQTQTVKISSFTTSFKKSPYNNPNRVFNIVREADIINGAVLMPDEIFDINKLLGPRTAATGWKEANGIRAGRYELEPGGGVCQGSSTLYNAVSMADLEIVERKPHSWPLSYVPIGRDATISTGGPNFRFKNNTSAPIYIVAYTDEKEKTVTYEIWGEPMQGGITEIKLVSKKTSTLESKGVEYLVDPALAPGETNVYVEERKGAVAETYKEYYKGTELVKRVLYTTDRYPSFKGVTYIGPDTGVPAAPVESNASP